MMMMRRMLTNKLKSTTYDHTHTHRYVQSIATTLTKSNVVMVQVYMCGNAHVNGNYSQEWTKWLSQCKQHCIMESAILPYSYWKYNVTMESYGETVVFINHGPMMKPSESEWENSIHWIPVVFCIWVNDGLWSIAMIIVHFTSDDLPKNGIVCHRE